MMDQYTRSGCVMHSHISFQQQEKNMKKERLKTMRTWECGRIQIKKEGVLEAKTNQHRNAMSTIVQHAKKLRCRYELQRRSFTRCCSRDVEEAQRRRVCFLVARLRLAHLPQLLRQLLLRPSSGCSRTLPKSLRQVAARQFAAVGFRRSAPLRRWSNSTAIRACGCSRRCLLCCWGD